MATSQKRPAIRWQEILAITVSLGVIGGGVYLATRTKSAPLPDDEKFTKAETKGSNITTSQALRKANQLYTIMDGPNWDNHTEFIRPFINVNGDGIKLIVNKFGMREGTYTFTKENLYQWIGGEADKTVMTARYIWKRAGLTPPF